MASFGAPPPIPSMGGGGIAQTTPQQQFSQQVVPDQHSGNGGGPPTIDLNALASYVQQFQNQKQQQVSPNPPGLQEALAALLKQNQQQTPPVDTSGVAGTTSSDKSVVPSKDGGGDTPMGENTSNPNDPQSLMEQISHLTKSLDEEKAKSKAFQVCFYVCFLIDLTCFDMFFPHFQEEKKREMKGFLSGIKDYVHSLDGVKDPTAKTKFMQVNLLLNLF